MKAYPITMRRIKVVLEEVTDFVQANNEIEALQVAYMTERHDWTQIAKEVIATGTGEKFKFGTFLLTAKKAIEEGN